MNKQIKKKNFEIIHQNNDEQFILLKIYINKELITFKLMSNIFADKIRLNISINDSMPVINKNKINNEIIKQQKKNGNEIGKIDNNLSFNEDIY